ncbi:MAG: hypothetical protein GX886_15920, partial [Comamonadaceae bacterium]|nr:hypothetical protein [Comamonadaceae bacterium]
MISTPRAGRDSPLRSGCGEAQAQSGALFAVDRADPDGHAPFLAAHEDCPRPESEGLPPMPARPSALGVAGDSAVSSSSAPERDASSAANASTCPSGSSEYAA